MMEWSSVVSIPIWLHGWTGLGHCRFFFFERLALLPSQEGETLRKLTVRLPVRNGTSPSPDHAPDHAIGGLCPLNRRPPACPASASRNPRRHAAPEAALPAVRSPCCPSARAAPRAGRRSARPSAAPWPRSEARRGGKEGVSTCKSRWAPDPLKK